jgi:hypothetical protein
MHTVSELVHGWSIAPEERPSPSGLAIKSLNLCIMQALPQPHRVNLHSMHAVMIRAIKCMYQCNCMKQLRVASLLPSQRQTGKEQE